MLPLTNLRELMRDIMDTGRVWMIESQNVTQDAIAENPGVVDQRPWKTPEALLGRQRAGYDRASTRRSGR